MHSLELADYINVGDIRYQVTWMSLTRGSVTTISSFEILTPKFIFTIWFYHRAHIEKNWTNLLKRNFDFEISFLFWDVLITKSIEDLLCFYMSKSSFRYIHSFFGFDCLTKATGHFGAVKIFEKYFRSNRFLMLGYNRVCNSSHRELTRTMLTAKFKLCKL